MVRRGSPFLFRTPRRAASSRAREEPPLRPRSPYCNAESIPDQRCVQLPGTRPESFRGHQPVRS
jgi:hypothetical protein